MKRAVVGDYTFLSHGLTLDQTTFTTESVQLRSTVRFTSLNRRTYVTLPLLS
jgi:hypothetical protein